MPILKRTTYIWTLLLTGALFIRLAGLRRDWVEIYYSTSIYPVIGKLSRWIFGWMPFSAGDLVYIFAGGWLLYSLIRGIKTMCRNSFRAGLYSGSLWLLKACLVIYIGFNLLWGLNYNRKGIAWQMNLAVEDSVDNSIAAMTEALRDQANAWKPANKEGQKFNNGRKEAIEAYSRLKNEFPWLAYRPGSVKPSLFGVLGNYMGYSGYYNPFSGEAQLNTHIPGFLIPFSTCHEIAHQLGYAKENEANFVGYLAARESSDSSMRYSAYLNMFLYANNELRHLDSVKAKTNFDMLSDPIKKDLIEYRNFLIIYQGPMEDLVDAFYHQFLKLNEQPAGRRSYNKVVLWLLAYYKERGVI